MDVKTFRSEFVVSERNVEVVLYTHHPSRDQGLFQVWD